MHAYEKRGERIRGVQPVIQDTARTLRHRVTPAEQILWQALRGKRLAGLRFRRQHPVGRFVLDFYAPACHLAIELDGGIHDGQEEQDRARAEYLQAYGYRVIRFRNEEVLKDLASVLERIEVAVQKIPTPASSCEIGEGKSNA